MNIGLVFALWFLLAFCLPVPVVLAQDDEAGETAFIDHVPPEILDDPRDKIVTIAIENDSLGAGSDRHFTSGVRVTYYNLNATFPDYAHRIADLIPTFDINRTSSLIYSVGQNLYTPEDISRRDADPDDRPWAAYLYTSIGMATLTGRHIDEIEASLGLVGPWALGEQSQKFIHDILSSPDPQGWEHQLKTEPGMTLSWQRRWIERASYEADGLFFSIDPYAGITVGNVHTYANTGLLFRLGSNNVRWEDTPLRVRPAMPGTGYFNVPRRGWDWHLFGGLEGRAVARNVFLDGNTFRDSPRVDKRHFVGDANLGLGLTLGPARVSYTVIVRSPEFRGQQERDIFGALSFGYRF